MKEKDFIWDERLGIRIPVLGKEWEQYARGEQERILVEWEMIRGSIPDRIKAIEEDLMGLQEQLNIEPDFLQSCRLNSDIAELASRINELNLWYRVNQELGAGRVHQ